MPPAIAVVALAVASYAAAAGASIAAVGFIAGAIYIAGTLALTVGVSMAIGAIAQAIGGKPKQADAPSLSNAASGRTFMVRSSVVAHRVIVGECLVSGPLVFVAASGASNEYIHMVIALAGHEVAEIGDIWLDDTLSTDARFSGLVTTTRHTGATDQTVDTDLDTAIADWTTAHRLRGIAYLYVRLTWSADVWLNGLPNVKALVRGRMPYDPRDGGTRWTPNAALCQRDYLRADFGVGAESTELDDTLAASAANVCDEYVTTESIARTFTAAADDLCTMDIAFGFGDKVRLTTTTTLPAGLALATDYYVLSVSSATRVKLASSLTNALAGTAINITDAGTGTHTMTRTAQLRYTANGAFDLSNRPIDIMDDILTASAGSMVYSQGKYRLYAGVYAAPTVTLTADDLRGPIELSSKRSRRDVFNAVRGVYVDRSRYYQATDFPPVSSIAYAAEDGATLYRDIELPYTTDDTRAQRLATLALKRGRQGLTVTFPAKLTAMSLSAWDTVNVTLDALGWSAKVFRVLEWTLSEDGGIDLTLQEESALAYGWLSQEMTPTVVAEVTLPTPSDRPATITADDLTTGAVVAHKAQHQNAGADEISVAGLSGELADAQPPKTHASAHAAAGGDPVKLDDLAAPDDNTDLDATALKHGLLPKLSGNAAHVLHGDGTWS